jgi:YVTN family beta-propeller protein
MRKKGLDMSKLPYILAGFLLLMLPLQSCRGGRSANTSLVTVTIGNNSSAAVRVRPTTGWFRLERYLAGIFQTTSAVAAIPSTVSDVRVTVSAADMSTITTTVSVAGLASVTIAIEVPNGRNRNFSVEGLNASGTAVYSGQTTTDLNGAEITLSILLTPTASPPTATSIFVANSGSNSVSVIDFAANAVVATFPVGTSPTGVVVNPATHRAYVANQFSNTVSVIDTINNAVIDTVNIKVMEPTGLGIDTSINKVFVSNNYFGSSVDYIDVANSNAVGTIQFGAAYCLAVAANPVTHKAYATDWGTVYVIDTVTSTPTGTSIAVGGTTTSWFGVAVNSVTNRVYVTDTTSAGQIFVINGNTDTLVTAIPTGGSDPEGIAVDQTANRAYVTNSLSGTVSVIDTATNTPVTTITVGTTPMAVAVYSAGQRAYVTNSGDGTVSVIDTLSNTVVGTIPVGTNPLGIAVSQ